MSVENLLKKWAPVLDHSELPGIQGSHKRSVTAQLLENQEIACRQDAHGSGGYRNQTSLLSEASPANNMGASSSTAGDGAVDIYDPVLISLVRRAAPNLIAYDICGVQPMTGPTGLIFAMRSRYKTQGGTEALFNEANTAFPNTAQSQTGASPADLSGGTEYTRGTGFTTAEAEALGDGSGQGFQEMAFSIEKVTVTAKTRALKAEYSMELAQDLKAVHGLDAETELANILSSEILAEINREVVRTVYTAAKVGAQDDVANAGTFNLDVDANGRWSVEKFKGLMFQIEQEANAIAKGTRRGKGNLVICSSDVASALQMAGVLDYTPALNSNTLEVDDTGNTFAGVLNGRVKVYVDPYAGVDYLTVGYRGTNPYDAGLFYCPYVPLQMVRAVGENSFQPKIGFKTRYGMVSNPFANGLAQGSGALTANANVYYRKVTIANLF